jgi:hypothetical protein
LWSFDIFYGYLVYFSRSGMLYQGYLATLSKRSNCTNFLHHGVHT